MLKYVDEKEKVGRSKVVDLLQKYGVEKIEESTYQYAKYDIEYTGNTTTATVEIKYRSKYSSNSFDSVILEKDKYESLMRKYEEDGKTPLYWTVFCDDVHWVVDCSKLEPKWVTRMLPQTNESDKVKTKEVTYIYRNDVQWIIRN